MKEITLGFEELYFILVFFKHTPPISLRTLSFTENNKKKNTFIFPVFTQSNKSFLLLFLGQCVYLHKVIAACMRNDEEEKRLSHKHGRKAVITLWPCLEFPLHYFSSTKIY